jgi:hypothetical protein
MPKSGEKEREEWRLGTRAGGLKIPVTLPSSIAGQRADPERLARLSPMCRFLLFLAIRQVGPLVKDTVNLAPFQGIPGNYLPTLLLTRRRTFYSHAPNARHIASIWNPAACRDRNKFMYLDCGRVRPSSRGLGVKALEHAFRL